MTRAGEENILVRGIRLALTGRDLVDLVISPHGFARGGPRTHR